MTWIITVLSIVGVIANIYKRSWCFIIWAALFTVYLALAVFVEE